MGAASGIFGRRLSVAVCLPAQRAACQGGPTAGAIAGTNAAQLGFCQEKIQKTVALELSELSGSVQRL